MRWHCTGHCAAAVPARASRQLPFPSKQKEHTSSQATVTSRVLNNLARPTLVIHTVPCRSRLNAWCFFALSSTGSQTLKIQPTRIDLPPPFLSSSVPLSAGPSLIRDKKRRCQGASSSIVGRTEDAKMAKKKATHRRRSSCGDSSRNSSPRASDRYMKWPIDDSRFIPSGCKNGDS